MRIVLGPWDTLNENNRHEFRQEEPKHDRFDSPTLTLAASELSLAFCSDGSSEKIIMLRVKERFRAEHIMKKIQYFSNSAVA